MYKYEALFILRKEDEGFRSALDEVKRMFQGAHANILEEKDIGLRDMTYEIAKQKTGHYYAIQLEIDPAELTPIEKGLKLNSNVIRHVFVRKDV